MNSATQPYDLTHESSQEQSASPHSSPPLEEPLGGDGPFTQQDPDDTVAENRYGSPDVGSDGRPLITVEASTPPPPPTLPRLTSPPRLSRSRPAPYSRTSPRSPTIPCLPPSPPTRPRSAIPLDPEPRKTLIAATSRHMIHLMECLQDANSHINARPDDEHMTEHILILEKQLNDARVYLSRIGPIVDPHLHEYATLFNF